MHGSLEPRESPGAGAGPALGVGPPSRAAVGAVIAVAAGSILLGGLNPLVLAPAVRPVLGNIVQLTAPLAALAACLQAAARAGGGRRSWLLFGGACISASLGQLLWARYELLLRLPLPFPSASFWLYALVHVFLISGVLLALKPARVPRLRVEIGLDGGLMLLAAAFLILRFLLEPPLLQGWIDRTQAVAILIGQVLSAGSLLFALGLLVWRDTLLPPVALGALTGSALLFELGNVLEAFGWDPHPAASGDAFELWWVSGWAVLALAGLTAALNPQPTPPPSGSRERVARRVRASLLPGFAIFLAVSGVDAATRGHFSSLSMVVILVLGVVLAVRIGNAFWAVEREAARRREAEQLAYRARLQAIANQLNPHFLFNTLHSVSALLEAEPSRAEAALNRLGGLLRYTVGDEEEMVQLAEEWSFTAGYLELEQLRLGDRLRSELNAEDAALDCLVPPLLVQPLVENAVRHGIAPRPEGGRVRVNAALRRGQLHIVVSDDGAGNVSGAVEEGIGLRGVRARLTGAFGESASMEVTTSVERGFTVSLTLPALEEEEL